MSTYRTVITIPLLENELTTREGEFKYCAKAIPIHAAAKISKLRIEKLVSIGDTGRERVYETVLIMDLEGIKE